MPPAGDDSPTCLQLRGFYELTPLSELAGSPLHGKCCTEQLPLLTSMTLIDDHLLASTDGSENQHTFCNASWKACPAEGQAR